jgi:hypothetical protein
MAKTIDLFPKQEKKDPLDEITMDNIVPLIRAAINGDEDAKIVVSGFLDFYEQHRGMFDIFGDDGDSDGDEEYDCMGRKCPMVLPRRDVKEYHVRIKLNNTDLKIWREVKVPSNITLQTLAELLLEVMGWMLEHMYQFRFKGVCYSMKEYIEDSAFPCNDVDLATVTLSDVLTEKGVRMKLEYDFGDSWEHDVWVKGIREYDKGEKPSITFVTGHGECPPEDCGGVWGYADLLELTRKKKLTAEERESLEWYQMDEESEFDPDYCDIRCFKDITEDYNDALQGYLES